MKSSLARALARSTLAAVVAGALCASAAAAQQPFTLLSTGINSSGVTIAAGDQDPFWTWQQTEFGGSPLTLPTDTYVPTKEFIDWQPDVANQYHWVSSTSSASTLDGNGNPIAGYNLWSTTFDLSGYDPTTATITFKCVIDNVAYVGIRLNSTLETSVLCGDQSTDYKFNPDITMSSGFISGENTLSFFSYGDGQTDGIVVDIEKAQADLASTTTTTTPEPASMLLVATGLVGLVPVMRRRRKA